MLETTPSNRSGFWNIAGVFLAILTGIALIFLLDTGHVTEWIAARKHTKLDEVIVVVILFLVGMCVLFLRTWGDVSRRLKTAQEPSTVAERARRELRRDLVGVGAAVIIGVVLVFLFDSGSLAEWLAKHKDTKIDEIIVTSIVLLIGLSFFSIRRWMDLSDSLRKYEELHLKAARLNREAALLGELSDLLQSCLSFEEAHPIITSRAQLLLPASSGAVYIIASSRNAVEVASVWGNPAVDEPLFVPQDCWALRRGRIHVYEDGLHSGMYCAHLGRERPLRAVCVPMMAHGETIGLLYVDTGKSRESELSPSQLAAAEQALARTIAEQASLALANLKLREILRTQSVRDPLTNLYNRRYMEESLDRELSRANRKKASLGLMMLDVDHFKRFNDTFGHEAGDMVLRALGNTLRAQFRAEDVICRYGGEEFTVILPDTLLELTVLRAEQLREATREVVTEFRGQTLERITLSIGVSSFPDHGTTREALLSKADEALYRAKNQGRDCVVAG